MAGVWSFDVGDECDLAPPVNLTRPRGVPGTVEQRREVASRKLSMEISRRSRKNRDPRRSHYRHVRGRKRRRFESALGPDRVQTHATRAASREARRAIRVTDQPPSTSTRSSRRKSPQRQATHPRKRRSGGARTSARSRLRCVIRRCIAKRRTHRRRLRMYSTARGSSISTFPRNSRSEPSSPLDSPLWLLDAMCGNRTFLCRQDASKPFASKMVPTLSENFARSWLP